MTKYFLRSPLIKVWECGEVDENMSLYVRVSVSVCYLQLATQIDL